MSLIIKLFEDYNTDDQFDEFIESINECISTCKRCVDEYSEESESNNMVKSCEDCIILLHATKDLIENESKLLNSICKILEISLNICIEECKKVDNEITSSCIESCKRCIIDCEKLN